MHIASSCQVTMLLVWILQLDVAFDK